MKRTLPLYLSSHRGPNYLLTGMLSMLMAILQTTARVSMKSPTEIIEYRPIRSWTYCFGVCVWGGLHSDLRRVGHEWRQQQVMAGSEGKGGLRCDVRRVGQPVWRQQQVRDGGQVRGRGGPAREAALQPGASWAGMGSAWGGEQQQRQDGGEGVVAVRYMWAVPGVVPRRSGLVTRHSLHSLLAPIVQQPSRRC